MRNADPNLDVVAAAAEADAELDAAGAPPEVLGVGVDEQLVVVAAVLEADLGALDLLLRPLARADELDGRLLDVGRLDFDVAPRQLHVDGELPRSREGLGPHLPAFLIFCFGGRRSIFASPCFM